MSKEKIKKKTICSPTDSVSCGSKCCNVDAIVEVDKRGQILLPKDVREKAKIESGDKFVLITGESEGEVCCISLIRSKYFLEGAKNMLGPIMKGLYE